MPTAPARTKTGCQNCRLRHLKCDDKQPSCTRCAQADLECVRLLNVRFCHNLNPTIATEKGPDDVYLHSQPWVSTSGTLSFVDETRDTVAIYDTRVESQLLDVPLIDQNLCQTSLDVARQKDVAIARPPGSSWNTSGSVAQLDLSTKVHPSPKRRRLTNDVASIHTQTPRSGDLESPSLTFPGFGEYCSPASSLPISGQDLSPGLTSGDGLAASNTNGTKRRSTLTSTYSFGTPSSPYPESRTGFLTDPYEAKLLRHFVEKLASSFDLTDSLCHFRNVIPQRAVHDPVLLNAILAASARHLSRIGNGDPYMADQYHSECIKHLIPMLDDEAAVLNENLLASTVILRYLEEIDVPLSGQLHPDGSGHLIGTHIFISAQETTALFGGLRLAAFWVGLRQEIYVAFVNQRSIIPPLQHCNVDRSFESADDGTWANRIIVHCAETLRFCFGLHEHERSPTRYLELLRYCEDWLKFTPSSYNPIFYRDADADSIFPEVMYLSDATVTGIQHYHLTLILLTAYDPRIPSLGPRRTAALRKMDEEIKDHVKMLCGLALSNSSTPPNFVTASMAVTMAGDKFLDVKEQEACLQILQRCESDHGWPTLTAQRDLKEAWGWTENIGT